ncbi:hypothetical protein O6H91_05G133200 [Diphasiastrum complanatum]|uniref:Uncharacterized protein n=1 Tax=Diphasiastrum complanatum TaxID=34168 RepID=A0ACC2DTP8_DIPCM|nr:hypothetical protein O6H91_05G133200 [Diphasiastrum complanatum]
MIVGRWSDQGGGALFFFVRRRRSSDGHMFEVDEYDRGYRQRQCRPLPNVTSKILAKVIEYCKYLVDLHKSGDEKAIPEEDVKAWDADFVKVDQATMFDLILAANHLNIKSLLDLTCQAVADMIKEEDHDLCL